MTVHYHLCNLCSQPSVAAERSSDTCWAESQPTSDGYILVGHPRPCRFHEGVLLEIDALPNPERGPLALASIERVVARATRAALEVAASSWPGNAPEAFAAHVDPLAPKDSTRQDPDTWARIGVLMGSKAAWSGSSSLVLPPDCPPGAAARCFIGAWSFAAGVVMQIRMEVGHGK